MHMGSVRVSVRIQMVSVRVQMVSVRVQMVSVWYGFCSCGALDGGSVTVTAWEAAGGNCTAPSGS